MVLPVKKSKTELMCWLVPMNTDDIGTHEHCMAANVTEVISFKMSTQIHRITSLILLFVGDE